MVNTTSHVFYLSKSRLVLPFIVFTEYPLRKTNLISTKRGVGVAPGRSNHIKPLGSKS